MIRFNIDRSVQAPFSLKATLGDGIISMSNISIEVVEILVAFVTGLAECGHSARLYQFKKLELRHCAYF